VTQTSDPGSAGARSPGGRVPGSRPSGSRYGDTRSSAARQAGVRQERKERTRQALLDAALGLLEQQSFGSLSLRQVTREVGIVPTAFYRHFRDMDELGLALVSDSFATLRRMIRAARHDARDYEGAIDRSAEVLAEYVQNQRAHFQFIVRERYSGVPVLRQAIRWELRLFVSELALDLSRFPILDTWPTDDLQMLAELIVTSMVSTAEAILDPTNDRDQREIVRLAKRQLHLIVVGVASWRPATNPSP
jgi:AcrR family transcriptional regulator